MARARPGSRKSSVYMTPELAREYEETGMSVLDLFTLGVRAARSDKASPGYCAGYQQALADLAADIAVLAAGGPSHMDGLAEADAMAAAELERLRYLRAHGHRLDPAEAARLAELESAELAASTLACGLERAGLAGTGSFDDLPGAPSEGEV